MVRDKARKDFQEGQGMTHLVTGSQVFHNGVPVQLLYRVALTPSGEPGEFVRSLWRSLTGRTGLRALTRSHSCTR